MTSLLLTHPDWLLPAAIFVVLSGAALVTAAVGSGRRMQALMGRGTRLPRHSVLPDALLFTSLILIVVALLGPRIVRQSTWITRSGVDVVLLLDLSRSMTAQDLPPSRLDRARRAAVEVLERLSPSSRAALAGFAGRGVLFTPLTPDRAALIEMVPALNTSLIQPGGSDLHAGLERALEAFEEGSQRPRTLLVLSDGEVFSPLENVGQRAADRYGVRIITVALGTDDGVTLPDHGVPLRDHQGEIVVSRRHTKPLHALSRATDGRLFIADQWGHFDLEQAVREIDREALLPAGEYVLRSVRVAVAWPFAALAFAILWLEGFSSSHLTRFPTRRRARMPVLLSLIPIALPLFVLLRAGPSGGQEPAPRTYAPAARTFIEIGLAHAEAGRSAEALNAFLAAALGAAEPRVAATAYHNLGVTALEQLDLETARDFFFDALALVPDDDRTRFNLEWTLIALETRRPADPEPEPSQQDRQEDESAPNQHNATPPAPLSPGPVDSLEAFVKSIDLDPVALQRWRARIVDDASRALQSAAHADDAGPRRPTRDRPRW